MASTHQDLNLTLTKPAAGATIEITLHTKLSREFMIRWRIQKALLWLAFRIAGAGKITFETKIDGGRDTGTPVPGSKRGA